MSLQPNETAGLIDGPGQILALIRNGVATTRAQIMDTTGLSRSTVAQRIDGLVGAGYIAPAANENSTGGRPTGSFQLNREGGVMLLAAIGAGAMQVAVTDMQRGILARRQMGITIADGPDIVLGEVARQFKDVLKESKHRASDVRGIGIGVPGPVEFAQGRVVRPPIMTGWDGYRVPDFFAGSYACPVIVDKDVNVMALGEHREVASATGHLLFIKISTGIGAGIILDNHLQRGAQGAAGDLGHFYIGNLVGGEPPLCRCGNRGCLEAYAAGWALTRQMNDGGHACGNVRDLAKLANDGEPDAVAALQNSGRLIGETIAMSVSLLNPSLVVLGGELAQRQGYLLAAVRETVYRRSLPLATRNLQIVNSVLGQDAGLLGAAHLVSDAIFAPAVVDAAVERHLAARG
ncbi:ROK family protein [Silvimonas sp. JCM 19000]